MVTSQRTKLKASKQNSFSEQYGGISSFLVNIQIHFNHVQSGFFQRITLLIIYLNTLKLFGPLLETDISYLKLLQCHHKVIEIRTTPRNYPSHLSTIACANFDS